MTVNQTGGLEGLPRAGSYFLLSRKHSASRQNPSTLLYGIILCAEVIRCLSVLHMSLGGSRLL